MGTASVCTAYVSLGEVTILDLYRQQAHFLFILEKTTRTGSGGQTQNRAHENRNGTEMPQRIVAKFWKHDLTVHHVFFSCWQVSCIPRHPSPLAR
jgi:hypothetical protein